MLFTASSSSVDSTSQPRLPQSHLNTPNDGRTGRMDGEDRDTLNNINIIKLGDEDGDNSLSTTNKNWLLLPCACLYLFVSFSSNNDPNGDVHTTQRRYTPSKVDFDKTKQNGKSFRTTTNSCTIYQPPAAAHFYWLLLLSSYLHARNFPLATGFYFRLTPFPQRRITQNDAIECVFASNHGYRRLRLRISLRKYLQRLKQY